MMRAIDRLHTDFPFMGSRMLRDQLQRQGHQIGRQHTRTLMRRMGINALYLKPKNTSAQNLQHKIYPYLLRKKAITPNQVWALDTSYIPMAKGFVYLTAVLDWATRKVLAHKIAITLEALHAVDVLNEALSHFSSPEIVSLTIKQRF